MGKRSKEEALKIKREKERERRKKIREDPIKRLEQQQKEKEKHKRQREMKVKKSIDELTARQKRARRKRWRINSKKYQQRKKAQRDIEKQIIENTPPNSSDEENLPLPRRVLIGIRRANKKKVARYRQKKEMKRKMQKLQEKLNRVTKRYERLKKKRELRRSTKVLSPLTKTNLLIEKAGCSANEPRVQKVKKRILFAEVIEDQLKHTYKSCKEQKPKQVIKKLMSGDIIKKFGLKKYCAKKIQYRSLSSLNQ